ncbi:AbrB/MazE/SpoVT family DNA-binding domain-containing protein [Roseiarcaceae bacterium H3SJ34-1]|uniref:AbrB/MazE/SpoVT family DNA-binding domain-containing protein n=1 Tax=Terripilifer ovatus TaxID=3032367 RepID=UPI003AB91FF1|nr:AbrB/MazE/SpoVT family DNA-binding domain-containing protein [Roseiarcaceae bacterium H3SJ34-1]
MTSSTKLLPDFKTALPKDVREHLKWREGQEFMFVPNGRNVLLIPVPGPEDLFGTARPANPQGYRARTYLH